MLGLNLKPDIKYIQRSVNTLIRNFLGIMMFDARSLSGFERELILTFHASDSEGGGFYTPLNFLSPLTSIDLAECNYQGPLSSGC